MTAHFTERIYLDQICRHAGLSKSRLLRAFTKEKGVTPYQYLETVRINEAKKLLSESVHPVEAAIRTGIVNRHMRRSREYVFEAYDVEAFQYLMGHSDIRMTLNTYTYLGLSAHGLHRNIFS